MTLEDEKRDEVTLELEKRRDAFRRLKKHDGFKIMLEEFWQMQVNKFMKKVQGLGTSSEEVRYSQGALFILDGFKSFIEHEAQMKDEYIEAMANQVVEQMEVRDVE